jgi:type III secretory pathway component EscR
MHGNETIANLTLTLTELKKTSFPKRALETQIRYFRRFIRKPVQMTVHEYFSEAMHTMMNLFPAEARASESKLLPSHGQTNFYSATPICFTFVLSFESN